MSLAQSPIELFTRRDFFILLFVRREFERFLSPQTKNAKRTQTIVKQIAYLILEDVVKVNQHVAANNHVKFIK